MDAFREMRDRIAELERKVSSMVRVGIVDKVDRAKCRVRVLFFVRKKFKRREDEKEEEESFSSIDLPVLVKQSVENPDYWMPAIGEQVTCVFLPGDSVGFVLGSFYSDEDPIPEGAEAEGMRVTEFADGSRVEYDTEASRLRVLVGDLETEFTPEYVRIGGSSANQPFVRGTDLKTLLSALIDLLAAHTHPTGVGPSGPPANSSQITAKKSEIDGALSAVIAGR